MGSPNKYFKLLGPKDAFVWYAKIVTFFNFLFFFFYKFKLLLYCQHKNLATFTSTADLILVDLV